MGVGTIAGLVLALLKIGLAWFENHREKVQQQIGEDREKLKQFQQLDALATSLRTVDERFARMSDDDVKAEIAKQGDWRD